MANINLLGYVLTPSSAPSSTSTTSNAIVAATQVAQDKVPEPLCSGRAVLRSALLSLKHTKRPLKTGMGSFRFHSTQKGMEVYRCALNSQLGSSVSTTGAGALQLGIPLVLSSFVDYSNLAGVFDLFKYVGCKLHYQPYNKYQCQPTNTGAGPAYVVWDPDNSSASASVATILQYDMTSPSNPLRSVNMADSWTYEAKFPSVVCEGQTTTYTYGVWLNINIATPQAGTIYLTGDTNFTYGFNKQIGSGVLSLEVEVALRQ